MHGTGAWHETHSFSNNSNWLGAGRTQFLQLFKEKEFKKKTFFPPRYFPIHNFCFDNRFGPG